MKRSRASVVCEHGFHVPVRAHGFGIAQHLLGLDECMAVILQKPLDDIGGVPVACPPRDAAPAIADQRLTQHHGAATADGAKHHHQILGHGPRRQRPKDSKSRRVQACAAPTTKGGRATQSSSER